MFHGDRGLAVIIESFLLILLSVMIRNIVRFSEKQPGEANSCVQVESAGSRGHSYRYAFSQLPDVVALLMHPLVAVRRQPHQPPGRHRGAMLLD
jgi:hypothetical protein